MNVNHGRIPAQTDYNTGDMIYNFIIKKVLYLEKIESFLIELEHTCHGSRFVHIHNASRDNAFGVLFKTIPEDSSGVAHILEHMVLCGSKKFPVKDPFFAMQKRSLNTFMNALTGSDKTIYAFSTQNERDYYNLMDVYLDALFFPELSEYSFKQEGWRIGISDDSENINDDISLAYQGVVYNEMKGAMSIPEKAFNSSLLAELYPDSIYSNNSGGDPLLIPHLSFEELIDFYNRFYHPSNAYFYSYGDLSLVNHIAFIENKVLTHIKNCGIKGIIPRQNRWDNTKTVYKPYFLKTDNKSEQKWQFCLAWLTADICDSFEIAVLTLLDEILLGNDASPLKKALIESGLGSSLSDLSGFDADKRDTMFVCGLKDINESAIEKIEKLIFDVFYEIAQKGVDDALVEASIHQIEFRNKEITNIPYPYGINLLISISGCWMNGGNLEDFLIFDNNLQQIQKEIRKGGFIEKKIHEYFIDNTHMLKFILYPDDQLEHKQNKIIHNEMESFKQKLSMDDIQNIKNANRELKRYLNQHEDHTCLPRIEISDIPPVIERITSTINNCTPNVSYYEQPTSGIFYFNAAAGCGMITYNALQWIPFYCYAFTKMGTVHQDYINIAQLINKFTGGIDVYPMVRTMCDDSAKSVLSVIVSGKCLYKNIDNLYDILSILINSIDFYDIKRLRSLFMEYLSDLESSVLYYGHIYAMQLAARNFSQVCSIDENWNGIHHLKFMKQIAEKLDDAQVLHIALLLTTINKTIFTRNNIKIALAGNFQILNHASTRAEKLIYSLTADGTENFSPDLPDLENRKLKECWKTATSVSFVAQSCKLQRMNHPDVSFFPVISKLLNSLYLHREVRVKGGAYGTFTLYNPENGLFSITSYRDPHIEETLKVYNNIYDFFSSCTISDQDVTEAILQVCSEIDRPMTPSEKVKSDFFRKLVLLTDEDRQSYKEKILQVKRKKLIDISKNYFNPCHINNSIAIITGEDMLKMFTDTDLGKQFSIHTF